MLRLTTLGATDLRDRLGRPVREVLAQPKRVALLVYLALEGSRGPVPRDRVLAAFWPESDETRARNALSQALHHLRQALGADVIESQGATTLGLRSEALWCDAVVLADAVARDDAELALDLYRGEFCPTLFVSGAPAVEEWLDENRRRLRRLVLAAARTLAERLDEAGDAGAAARVARRALALRPDDEGEVRVHLALLERAGDVTGALRAYDDFAKRLASDLEVEPAAETRGLIERMRRRRAGAAAGRQAGAGDPADPAGSADAAAGPAAGAPVPVPPGAQGPPRARHRRRALTAMVLATGAIIALAVAASRLKARSDAATSGPRRTVAVFPFAVRGGPPLVYLSDGMADLLAAKLDGTADLHATDPRSVVAAADGRPPDPGTAAALAQSLGAQWFVLGNVTTAAGRLELDGTLYQVGRAEAVAAASVSGDTAGLFQLVDDLAGRLLASLAAGRDTSLTRLAAVTTSSLPALKAYLRGEQALRAGHDARAAAAFREATELDSTFALAWYRLAVVSTWVSFPGADPGRFAANAARHDRKLTPLGRDLLAAYRAYRELDHGSERRFREITQAHPDNVEAWFMLGEAQFHYGPWLGRSNQAARAAFARVLALDPGNSHAILHLARLAAADGRASELESLTVRSVALHRDAERTLEMRALRAWIAGDSAAAAAVTREASAADPVVVHSLMLAAVTTAQDLQAATALRGAYVAAADGGWVEVFAGQLLSTLALSAGSWDTAAARRIAEPLFNPDWLLESQALAAAEPFLPVSRARLAALRDSVQARRDYGTMAVGGRTAPPPFAATMRPYLLALLSLRLGDSAAADRHGAALRAAAAAGGEASGTAGQLLLALGSERLRAAGQPARALQEIERLAVDLRLPRLANMGVRERFARAELLLALGRGEEALPWYESLQQAYDLPFMAPARLRLAQIHERAGRTERAVFNYRRFIRLWRSADAEFQPMVAEARAALARLGAPPAP